MVKVAVWVVGALVVLVVGAAFAGAWRWRSITADLRQRLEARAVVAAGELVELHRGSDTPQPVRRYLNLVLTEGSPKPRAVAITHAGTFNQSESGEQWLPFTSDQLVTLQPPGFDWNASIAMFPGASVRVHDAYMDGKGYLHAALLGLVTVAKQTDGQAFAEGELMRFLAESPWYPAVLLPGHGVEWTPIDAQSAEATLRDGAVSVTLTFGFGQDGLVETVSAKARGRMVGTEIVPTPWRGRFSNYEKRNDTLIPLDSEVAWLLPEGEHSYFRGHIASIDYE